MNGDCSNCGMPQDDWTPGCRTCVSRHYKAAIRSGDPDVLRQYRATARAHIDAGVQERARRQRDGELLSAGSWLGRDAGGRWLRKEAVV